MRQTLPLASAVALMSLTPTAVADTPPYQPCPLLRAYYPALTISKEAETVKSFAADFTSLFDHLIESNGSEDFGAITPNTTSFSVVLFSGSETTDDDPIFFEYHYTAPKATKNSTVDANTIFPLGTLTQLFTVYSWLVEVGDGHWDTSITVFLPELNDASAADLAVEWDDITVGALAGHMSGLARDCKLLPKSTTPATPLSVADGRRLAHACILSQPCPRADFIQNIGGQAPLFLPDTTPVISNAAFQLLALALEAQSGNRTLDQVLSTGLFEPLGMANSGLLTLAENTQVFAQDLNGSAIGEPGALSMLSTAADLARAGHAMLSSRLISPAATRRWLQPVADTSNLRNAIGRPWEIYHAGRQGNSSILDVFTKTGSIGHYASYFGLAPDFDAGFAILAHEAEAARGPDLNVYADIVSLAVAQLQDLAAAEMAARYAGTFVGPAGTATFTVSGDGPGLAVSRLEAGEVDLRAEIAAAAGVGLEDLDFRLYPSNVATETRHQFVAVFQDKGAPVDMGTPTCVTWQDVGALGLTFDVRVMFDLDMSGKATNVTVAGGSLSLMRVAWYPVQQQRSRWSRRYIRV
ncbi:Putative beta-lactamase/transpeptidase [Colletotrichum destructivum]|uniref:Beta-lactamase/transpeptidase n=1 Tax=Colletotrichum destructivum TaxID=34406 RepID=A0AAX4IGU4_9PEZI|nr:Putative beta-lactamase/transpeptidase [Colletotrichum destructivum]